jgi:hypothetical protein
MTATERAKLRAIINRLTALLTAEQFAGSVELYTAIEVIASDLSAMVDDTNQTQ